MVAVGSGLATQVVAKDETTYGVAPSLTSGVDSFEILSETLELKKTAVVGTGLAGGKVYERTKRRVVTNYAVSGDIKLQAPTRNLGFWLRYMVGDFTQTPTQILSSGVYKTIFQPRSPMLGHSFTVQEGIATADNATVEPFTYVGNKLTGWELSIATGGIADLTLTLDGRNELAGAGNGDPLNGSVPALAAFAPSMGGSAGLQLFHFREATVFSGGTPTLVSSGVTVATPAFPLTTVPVTNTTGVPVYVTITGGTLTVVAVNGVTVGSTAGTYLVPAGQTIAITFSVAPTWTWALAPNIPATTVPVVNTSGASVAAVITGGTVTTILVNGTSVGSGDGTYIVPAGATIAVTYSVQPTWVWNFTTLSLASSTALGNVKSCNIKHDFKYDTNRMFVGNSGFKAEQIEDGYRAITGSATIEWLSAEAIYNAYAADTTSSIELTFTGPTVGGQTYLLDIILPSIKFEGESPKVAGPQVVTQAANFVGYDDEATVPIQITYQSEDVTF